MIKKIGRLLCITVMVAAVTFGAAGCNGAKEPVAATAVTTVGNMPVDTTAGEKTEISFSETTEEGNNMTTEELTLCGVRYSYSSGMEFGRDRSVNITDKEIVSASFYPWEGQNNYEGDETEKIEIENQPITVEQWAEIEKAITNILPILEEYHKTYNPFSVIGETMMLDGGDKSGFSLTWRSPDGSEKTVSYYQPNDRRYYVTVIDTLMETVHPVGREIVWYGEPVLDGIHVASGDSSSGRKGNFSFQCTRKNEEEWWYFAYFGLDGNPVSLSLTVDESCWSVIDEKIKALDIESLKKGEKMEKYITLYYSDGKNVNVLPDKKLLNELESFFTELSGKLNKEQ